MSRRIALALSACLAAAGLGEASAASAVPAHAVPAPAAALPAAVSPAQYIPDGPAPVVTVARAANRSDGTARTLQRRRGGAAAPTPAPTTTSPQMSTPQPVGPGSTMRLAYRDEFDGSTLDQSVWTPLRGYGSGTYGTPFNLTTEAAGFDPSRVSVSGGNLRLSATNAPITLPLRGSTATYPYTSGVVTTEGKKTFGYGFLETRMWVPDDAGYWPAFWMTSPGIALPEVDIAEFFTASDSKLHPFVNLHWGADWTQHQEHGIRPLGVEGQSYGGSWHTYGLRWAPGVLETYLDGVKGPVIARPEVPAGPMFLLFNLSVHQGATPRPATMLIDYVRVWQ